MLASNITEVSVLLRFFLNKKIEAGGPISLLQFNYSHLALKLLKNRSHQPETASLRVPLCLCKGFFNFSSKLFQVRTKTYLIQPVLIDCILNYFFPAIGKAIAIQFFFHQGRISIATGYAI